MENASKALIIAGSILVSIMIIGLGVVILNNVRNTINSANLNSEEAQANNEKFTAMFKQNASASEVKNLVNLIRSNNITAENDREGVGKIYILFNGEEKDAAYVSKNVKNGIRYSIDTPENSKSITESEFLEAPKDYNNNDASYYYNGFLRVIEIKKNSNSDT